MPNLTSPAELQAEFEEQRTAFDSYHARMQWMLEAYDESVFYEDPPNVVRNVKVKVNFLQIFADKLWDYLSPFPKHVVPPVPNEREQADKREKILYSTYEYNQSEMSWLESTFDQIIMSVHCQIAMFDYRERCARLKRADPRNCYWVESDLVQGELDTFWYAEPMTAAAIKRRFGITISKRTQRNYKIMPYDLHNEISAGKQEDYYLVVTRVDADTYVQWVADQMIIKPFRHNLGVMPADLSFMQKDRRADGLRGKFYLDKLIAGQAEFNELLRQRANIVRRLGNPVVYGRGINKMQVNSVKDTLATAGGFIGLKENGELGILTIPETQMIDKSLQDEFDHLKLEAGFPTATLGELVGANTSGDALGMYFQPTTKMVDRFNIANRVFWKSQNAKILAYYDKFLLFSEQRPLQGYVPRARMMPTANGLQNYNSGATFGRDDINGNYNTVIIMQPVTPKDDINYKRFLLDAVRANAISRTTFYDELQFQSPQDEFETLKAEMQEPYINPEGTSRLMETAIKQQQAADQPAMPAGASDVPTDS